MRSDCLSGTLLCGACKGRAANLAGEFVASLKERRASIEAADVEPYIGEESLAWVREGLKESS